MSTFLLILAVVLWVGFKAYRKVNVEAGPVETGDAPQRPNPSVRPAVESLFGGKVTSSEEQPYFTYEAMSDQPIVKSEKAAEKLNTDIQAEPAEFDLRQAVIYQTILNNNYISEYQHR